MDLASVAYGFGSVNGVGGCWFYSWESQNLPQDFWLHPHHVLELPPRVMWCSDALIDVVVSFVEGMALGGSTWMGLLV